MNKEISLLLEMCRINRKEYSSGELAAILGLKFVEGVYPYVRKLLENKMIIKSHRGNYTINPESTKVQTVKLIQELVGADARVLFTNHTKRILQRFGYHPILKSSELPYNNLKIVKKIATKSKIFFTVPEGNTQLYVIRSWEEPTKKLLDFFEIKLSFDDEQHKHNILKKFSAFTGAQQHLKDSKDKKLSELNLKYFLDGNDFILNRIILPELTQLKTINELTLRKKNQTTNPFDILSKINDWKIKYVYNTDKIEGNPLTMEEVRTILTEGDILLEERTQKKNILETTNSKTALDNIFNSHNELNVEFLKKLHLATQQGIDTDAGEFKKEDNCIVDFDGTLIDYTTPPKFVEERISELLKWYNSNRTNLHPLILATIVHNQFAYIHPFTDGNGRVARLLFNFILIKHGYFPIIFYNDQKQKYYSSLRLSKEGDIKYFLAYSIDLYREQLESF